MSYILDTNVISELAAARPDPRVIAWVDSIEPDRFYLSVITIGELKKGIEKLPASDRKTRLLAWLEDDLLVRFQSHLLPVDCETMLIWGSLNAALEALGQPMGAVDALLAATAIQKKYTLVTRNTSHFTRAGVDLLNPWDQEESGT